MEELQKKYEDLVKSSADISTNKEMKEMKDIMADKGMKGVKQYLRANSDKWKNTVLHIAVIGISGAGKSALINALCGMEAEDEGGAKVGFIDTTEDLTPYKHPKHPNLIFWDTPGIGGFFNKLSPTKKYLKRAKFDQYDFFMIVSLIRFTEDELWLVKQIQKQKKRFYFIRSHIDTCIYTRCARQPHRTSCSPEDILCDVRNNYYENLMKAGIESPKVFLVDNHERESYDFGTLEEQLLEDFGSTKMEIMGLSLSTPTETCEYVIEFSDEDSEQKETSNLDLDADARIDEEIKKLQSVMEMQGIEGVKQALKADSDKWKNTVLHIAVTGSSGAGKSAFINALRGIEAEDEGGAKVGVTETTTNLTPYRHPNNPNFIVWDMPGVGTPKFPQDKYLERVKFDQYDFFTIVSNARFTQHDVWLAEQTQEQEKRFYFIRSKIDIDIYSDSRSNKNSHSPEKVLSTVRDDCYENLIKAGIESPKVFLVDNHERQSYDFGLLEAQLLEDSGSIKIEAMALSLSTLTREVLEKKKEVLQGRIDNKAKEIACEMSFLGQQQIFENEIVHYKDQFYLDDKTLQDNKVIMRLSEENLAIFQTFSNTTFGQIANELMTISSREHFFKRIIRLVRVMYGLGLIKSIPVIQFSCLSLQQNLDKMYKMALQIYGTEAQKGLVRSALTPGKNPTTK